MMSEIKIFNDYESKQTIWNVLQQVPGLSDPMLLKICSIFCIRRNVKIYQLNKAILKELESFVLNNFIVGARVLRAMSLAVTTRFISRSRRGIRSRQGLPINGQRTHSNSKTPRRLKGHWVLPEVLKNPVAFFNFNNNKEVKSNLLEKLRDIKKVPVISTTHRNTKKTVKSKKKNFIKYKKK